MKILKNLYSIFVYIFIVFIVIIITLMFGTPDFISKTVVQDPNFIMQVEDQVITKRDFERTYRSFIAQKFEGKYPENESFVKQIKDYLYKDLSKNTIFLAALNKMGYYPLSVNQNTIIRKYLIQSFPNYFSEDTQNFKKFKKEILNRYKVSEIDLREDAIKSFILPIAQKTFENVIVKNNYIEKFNSKLLAETKISYHIFYLDKKNTTNLIDALYDFSEDDLLKFFNKQEKKKNKAFKNKTTLNKKERDKALKDLKQKQEKDTKSKLIKNISDVVKNQKFNILKTQYKMNDFFIKDVALNANLELSPKDKKRKNITLPNLNNLSENEIFRNLIFNSRIKEFSKPLEVNNEVYLISIIKRDIPKTKHIQEILKKHNTTDATGTDISTKINALSEEALKSYEGIDHKTIFTKIKDDNIKKDLKIIERGISNPVDSIKKDIKTNQ